MKHYIGVLFAVIILLLSSCGHKKDMLTWQEQYDLGVKYLFEENYEAAIIAFTSSIEIDAKQVAAYIGLGDAYIGAGDYAKAEEAITRAKETCSESLALERVIDSLDFLKSEEVGIKITSCYFDAGSYQSGSETDFLVSVTYICPESEDGVIMFGANTSTPDSFMMLDEGQQVTGRGRYQYLMRVTPVQWEDAPFGIYAALLPVGSSDDLPEFTYDILYLDPTGSRAGSSESAPSGSDDVQNMRNIDSYGAENETNGSSEHQTLLSKALTDNMLQFDEINFLGHSIIGLDIEIMKTYIQESGLYICADLDKEDHWWIQACPDMRGLAADFSAMQYKNKDIISSLSYERLGTDHERQIPIGIRDIYTFDSCKDVLTKLGFANTDELNDYFHQIQVEYDSFDEINAALSELTCKTESAEFAFTSRHGAKVMDNGKKFLDQILLEMKYYDYPNYSFQFVFSGAESDMSVNQCNYLIRFDIIDDNGIYYQQ